MKTIMAHNGVWELGLGRLRTTKTIYANFRTHEKVEVETGLAKKLMRRTKLKRRMDCF